MSNDLLNKIKDKQVRIGIIGMGYVGLPLSLAFCDRGFSVVGFDTDQIKCEKLNNSETYIKHVPADNYAAYVENGQLKATFDFADLSDVDAILICVPTPLNKYREPDLSYVEKTAQAIAKHGRKGQLVVLESSTYPGTTSEILGKAFSDKGFEDGKDVYLAYSPEREDPSNPNFTTRTIPKVVGADHDDARLLSKTLYEQIIDVVVPVSTSATAEAVKLTENIFRSVNIALVNELKLIYERMGVDIWEVVEAASTKPFGYMPFYPGPGLGGHCIPIDPFYLTWKAREFGVNTRFIELAGEVNTAMPHYVVERLGDALSKRAKKSLTGANILIVGVAYKSNLDDDRESPSYKIIDLLEDKSANVSYHDPYIPVLGKTRKYPEYEGRRSVDLTADAIKSFDAVVVCTAHENIDWSLVSDHASLIVDTRNAMAKFKQDNVIKA